MVSIPSCHQGPLLKSHPVDIKGGNSSSKQHSWKSSLEELSKSLQVICGSPDCHDQLMGSGTNSPNSSKNSPSQSPSPGYYARITPPSAPKISPLSASLTANGIPRMGRSISVRHEQSDEKFRERLTSICRSGGSLRRRIKSDESNSRVMARRAITKNLFRARVDVGDYSAEELRVYIQNSVLRVHALPKKKARDKKVSKSFDASLGSMLRETPDADRKRKSTDFQDKGILLKELPLPQDIDPSRLMCILRDGVLDVKLSAKKYRHSPDALPTVSEYSPLVIDDDGSARIKLVLQVPLGVCTDEIKVKSVDENLIVSAKSAQNLTASFTATNFIVATTSQSRRCSSEVDDFERKFVLPETVDPFTIKAHVNADNQLIIEADLAPRSRCYTL